MAVGFQEAERTVIKWNLKEEMVWVPQPQQRKAYWAQTEELCLRL